jgi:hypothetical protein
MLLRSDDGYKVQGAAIDEKLTWKTVERISFALDLIPMHTAVDHGEINSGDALTQSQFVKNQGVILMLMKTTHLGIQATPDINVSDLRHWYLVQRHCKGQR